ncbi:MAG: glycerol-3-phosphate 1-O-acyltransferase PlsY [Caulobacteraceae bacterium]|nr:glycerol-3-phosphate 1-O-acyltransferase PlsY [Caulobacteraceae bacterium]
MDGLASTGWAALGACVLGGYLLGSIPFGVIATRLGGAGDLRQVGSGNIGATNVLRTGRRDLALATLIGDAAKGAVAALVAGALVSPLAAVLAAGAAFVGHLFPVWLGFHGGKGVATFFGILFALAWPAGLAAGAAWLLVFAASRISSLGALAAAVVAPVAILVLDETATPRLILAGVMAVLIFLRHRANIGRLLAGEEPRMGRRAAG